METKKRERISWIDSAKGLGIILVVLGHNIPPEPAVSLIYAFHMPLFFFLSGYLENPDKYSTIDKLLFAKLKRLIMPYFLFNIMTYSYWLFIDHPVYNYDNVIKPIIGIFYGVGSNRWLLHNSALWFLPCLFMIEFFFYLIHKYCPKKSIKFILLLFTLFGYTLTKIIHFRLPWSTDVALIGLLFFEIGYQSKNSKLKQIVKNAPSILSILSALTYLLIFNRFNPVSSVDMNYLRFGNIILFYLSAFSGIYFIVGISRHFCNNIALKFLGHNSMLIFGLHIISIKIFMNYLGIVHRNILADSILLTIGEIAFLFPVIFALNMIKENKTTITQIFTSIGKHK